ncbi:hypothetical protein SK128_005416 [Halocaridina rubra]|uniref:Uncharacterized protein n=1 Tax=Halocaridina rubra TaxID=373956 RepID=A0AAN8XB80_HALRR
MSNCHHVLDQLLDQTRSSPCQGHSRRHLLTDPLHATRQLAESCNESIQEAENGGFQDPPPAPPGESQPESLAHGHFPSRTCVAGSSLHHLPGPAESPGVTHLPKFGPGPNMPRPMLAELKEAREKAILVDRFSRVAFPLSFTLLNILYWAVYFEW